MNDSTARKYAGFAVFFLILSLVLILSAAAQGTIAKEGKKKPRIELTKRTLRDLKNRLEWLLPTETAPTGLSWHKASRYPVRLNMQLEGGYQDWRLPTREELQSLVDYVKGMGFDGGAPEREVYVGLRNIGLRNVQPEHYWTSTEYLYNDGMAWVVDFFQGKSEMLEKRLYENVIIVRSLR